MVGNVLEFIDKTGDPNAESRSWYAQRLKPPPGPQEPWFEIRGRSFNLDLARDYGGVWEEAVAPAGWKSSTIGFRCVKDVLPAH